MISLFSDSLLYPPGISSAALKGHLDFLVQDLVWEINFIFVVFSRRFFLMFGLKMRIRIRDGTDCVSRQIAQTSESNYPFKKLPVFYKNK